MLGNVFPVSCDKLSCCARSRNSQVGGIVADSGVYLMTDCAYDRNIACCNSPNQPFFIETPEIFHTSASAGDDDDFHIVGAVEKFNASCHAFSGGTALNLTRIYFDVQSGKTPSGDIEKVSYGGSIGAGDNTDSSRHFGNRLLPFLGEKSFGGKFFCEFFKFAVEVANSSDPSLAAVELIFSAGLIYAEGTEYLDFCSVFDAEFPHFVDAAEPAGTDLGTLIF